jgi:mycothiol synthase
VEIDVRLSPLGKEHIPAWNELLAEIEKVDRTGEHYNEADLVEEIDNPDLELGKDIVGAFSGDELVGYFCVYPRPVAEDRHKIVLDGATRPDVRGQGVGSVLSHAMHRRALEAHRERHPELRAHLSLRGRSDNSAQERLMADIGLVPERWSFVMRADLASVPADGRETPRLPDGLVLRTYDESMAAAMHAAHNAAFVDHPNFTPWSDSMWEQWVTGSRSFRPKVSFVVVEEARPDAVVAYLQTSEFDAYHEQTGRREAYVGKVGTVREHRGKGLAGSLLRHALQEYHAAGYDEASLDVDSENPTGALGIYLRAGFEVESRWTDYAAEIEAGA